MANLTVEECNHIVAEFRTARRPIFQNRNAHALVVRLHDGVPILQLRVHRKLPSERLAAQERMPASFAYEYGGQQKNIDTEVVEAVLPKALGSAGAERSREIKARAGISAWGIDLKGSGTAGWNILLNNVPVCVSNWHVLCGLGNATPYGRRVIIGGLDIASLHIFEPLYFGGAVNQWDFALAKYDSLNVVDGAFRPCDDGSQMPTPKRLSPSPPFHANYHKVGNTEPICRTGTLEMAGYVTIDHDGQTAIFERQLIFSKMHDDGDSGSVIVKSDDHTVTGLLHGGGDTDSVANPLYQNPWIPVGVLVTNEGSEIPAFVGNPKAGGTFEPTVSGTSFPSVLGHRLVDDLLMPPDELPSFSVGKLFLKAIPGVIDFRFTPPRVQPSMAIPVAIRPGVAVEVIVGGIDVAHFGGMGPPQTSVLGVVLLCFG